MLNTDQQRASRRDFLACASAATGVALATGGALEGRAEGAPDRPNVVFLISDDQGWGDYGFMGHPHIQTPHLDRLSRESVTFTRGYVAAPLCCPSLAAIVTGLHPHQNKRTCNDPPKVGKGSWNEERLALRARMIEHIANAQTLPRLLAPLGYWSMQTGKWWEGHYSRGGFTHGMTHGDPKRGGRHGDVGLKIGRDTMQPIWDFVDEATAAKRPFFLWYAPMMPHSPHNPPERLFEKYRPLTPSPHIARYWAMCEWFDETCGQLLDYLDQKGLRDNTLVIYVCDNGWIQQPDSPRFAPRSKRSAYEGGIRTPIMVRWPGHATPRRDDRSLVGSIDMAPTALAACGLKPGPAMQGVNLLDAEAVAARKVLCGAEYSHDAVDVDDPVANLQVRYAVGQRWKLLLPYRKNNPQQPVELFDVIADPNEEHNLAPEHHDLVEQMRDQLNAWWPVDDPLPLKYAATPPKTIDFDFTQDPSGWTRARDIGEVTWDQAGLLVKASGDDPILTLSPCDIDPDAVSRIRVRLSATAGERIKFAWGTEEASRVDPGKEIEAPLTADGECHEYVLEVGQHPKWRGAPLKRLRFDPGDAKGVFRIVSIKGEK